MTQFLRNLWQDEAGQDLAEYTMLIVLIAIACIGAVTALGEGVEAGLRRGRAVPDRRRGRSTAQAVPESRRPGAVSIGERRSRRRPLDLWSRV
jgi:Flp pilus assembly pilin Flp